MKKLMFAVAAVAAGVAMADVTSANIVGYAESAELSAWGATMCAAQFGSVGSATGAFLIKDVAPVGDDTTDNMTIQILNDDGTTDITKSFTWDGSAWINDGTGDDASEESFDVGTGMWIYSNTDEPASIRSSGEVFQKNASYPLSPWGAVGVGNPYPVNRKLEDIVPLGEDTTDNVTIQILNDDGTTDITKSWTWDGSTWMNDGTGEESSSYEIGPGVGMWVYSNSDEDASLFIAQPQF